MISAECQKTREENKPCSQAQSGRAENQPHFPSVSGAEALPAGPGNSFSSFTGRQAGQGSHLWEDTPATTLAKATASLSQLEPRDHRPTDRPTDRDLVAMRLPGTLGHWLGTFLLQDGHTGCFWGMGRRLLFNVGCKHGGLSHETAGLFVVAHFFLGNGLFFFFS